MEQDQHVSKHSYPECNLLICNMLVYKVCYQLHAGEAAGQPGIAQVAYVPAIPGVGGRWNTGVVLVSKSLTDPSTRPRVEDFHEDFPPRSKKKKKNEHMTSSSGRRVSVTPWSGRSQAL